MDSKLISGSVISGLIAAVIYIVIARLFASSWTTDTMVIGAILGAATAFITWVVGMVIARNKRA